MVGYPLSLQDGLPRQVVCLPLNEDGGLGLDTSVYDIVVCHKLFYGTLMWSVTLCHVDTSTQPMYLLLITALRGVRRHRTSRVP
jgi:hypothetical protein